MDFSYTRRNEVIEYLQQYYGINFVASIGNVGTLGVKSGLKDVSRYFEIPFDEANSITSTIDSLFDSPDLSFKDIDDLKDSPSEADRQIYNNYCKLEEKYPEIFKYARKFEGISKSVGMHASGVLITPIAINDILPTRTDNGVMVTLYDGVTLEKLNFIKFDILALKTVDIIDETIKLIDPSKNYYNMYDIVKDNDDKTYELIQFKETDGLFQMESDLFKHTIGEMKPNCLNDISALNAICRPGPLSAGLDKQYNDTKNHKCDMTEPLRNTLDIVKDTYGTIIYQEQVMAISVKVCGFNANQSDSIVRKIIGKKIKEKLAMLRRMMIWGKKNIVGPEGWKNNEDSAWYDPNCEYGDEICGALANGYSYEEMEQFYTLLIGFASYCFNKSHAMCYGYIGYITAYLKAHYPAQFMTALLSGSQTDATKIERYISVARDMEIEIKSPDINKSKATFSLDDKTIYYGLGAIKSVGNAAIPNIIENAPFKDFNDFYDRTNHTLVKKNVITNLVLAGCFDFENENRYEILKKFIEIKQLDEEDKLNDIVSTSYNKAKCIEHEKDLLGISITHISDWEATKVDNNTTIQCKISKLTEKNDKNGKLMCFIDVITEGNTVRCLIFSSKYRTLRSVVDLSTKSQEFIFKGKKTDKNTLIVDNIERIA